MEISRLEFPTPVMVIDNFLSTEEAATCLGECIALEPVYMPASVGAGSENRRDPGIRRNDVVMMDDVFRAAPARSKILTILNRKITSKEMNPIWHEGYTIFDIVNYATWREMVLSRYGKCDFYGRHRDTMYNPERQPDITHRLVTIVFYLNTEPEQFTGGALTLFEGESKVTIPPHHNRAVIFPSYTFHEVANVTLPPDAPFSAGRFSINYWLGFR